MSLTDDWADLRSVDTAVAEEPQDKPGPKGPKLMLFDEESGAKLTEQVNFAKPETQIQQHSVVAVPWREWRD